jgi:hypothetical protein
LKDLNILTPKKNITTLGLTKKRKRKENYAFFHSLQGFPAQSVTDI